MLEREIDVDADDLYWNDPEVFNKYSHALRKILYSMRDEGVVFVNLSKVKHMDFLYAWDTIALIQCKNGIGPLKHKHLIFRDPHPNVRETILEAVDEAGEAFLEVDKNNVLRARGKTITLNLQKTLFYVLDFTSKNKLLTASDLLEFLDVSSIQACSDFLRDLYGWGLICKQEEAGKRGRPIAKYYAFWPEGDFSWELPSPDNPKELVPFAQPDKRQISLFA